MEWPNGPPGLHGNDDDADDEDDDDIIRHDYTCLHGVTVTSPCRQLVLSPCWRYTLLQQCNVVLKLTAVRIMFCVKSPVEICGLLIAAVA